MASKKKAVAVAKPEAQPPAVAGHDAHQINARLQRQVSALLKQLEENEKITLRERYMALMTIARIQYVFLNLRKEKAGDPDVGSTVRKYAGAFAKDDAGRRKKVARPAPEPERPEPQPELDQQWWDDNDDDNAA